MFQHIEILVLFPSLLFPFHLLTTFRGDTSPRASVRERESSMASIKERSAGWMSREQEMPDSAVCSVPHNFTHFLPARTSSQASLFSFFLVIPRLLLLN